MALLTSTRSKHRPLVLLGDEIDHSGVVRLQRTFDVEMLPSPVDVKRIDQQLARVEALIVRRFRADAAFMEKTPILKLIAKHGAGVDNIDLTTASLRDILVTNTPGANAKAVAEGAIALMLAVLRRLSEADLSVRSGAYDQGRKLKTRGLIGCNLGLIGFGQIARDLTRIAQDGFQMNVCAFDPHIAADQMEQRNVKPAESLAALLKWADVVSIHAPLNNATHHLISRGEIALMRTSAILINTARGGIVDEDALHHALENKQIAGAALDVFEQEPPSANNPLFAFPNVVLSPHIAGVTFESLRTMAQEVAQAVEDTFAGVLPIGILNLNVWERRRKLENLQGQKKS